MSVTVRVNGLTEMMKKLDGKFLLQPEVEHVRDATVKRIDRTRKTKGYRNNPLNIEVAPLTLSGGVTEIATVGTPLNWPRRTGSAWHSFVFGLARGSFMRNQLNSASKKIAARWAS